MQKQVGKIGAIRRNITGKACTACGSQQYQLRLTPATTPGKVTLRAQCCQCAKRQRLTSSLNQIVWM